MPLYDKLACSLLCGGTRPDDRFKGHPRGLVLQPLRCCFFSFSTLPSAASNTLRIHISNSPRTLQARKILIIHTCSSVQFSVLCNIVEDLTESCPGNLHCSALRKVSFGNPLVYNESCGIERKINLQCAKMESTSRCHEAQHGAEIAMPHDAVLYTSFQV